MIPRFEVGQLQELDVTRNGSTPEDAWEIGNTPDPSNQEYGHWHEVSGSELDSLIGWETRELQRLDAASATPEAFEESASKIASDPNGTCWDSTELSQCLDFGIVGCVAAFNFLGVPTTSSCRGHYGSPVGRVIPHVRFVGDSIDEETWELIRTTSAQVGCQLTGCGDGLVELVGHSCIELLQFARRVREIRPA